MFTKWDQVEQWIKDNNFKRWILYKDNTRTDKIVDSASFTISDLADKLAMTEKYLRMGGGRAHAAGFSTNGVQDATVCEIRLEDEQQGTSGIGSQIQPLNIGEIEDRIRKQLRAEIEADNYRKEKEAFEKAKAEFEEEKQSALGALVHYFAPVGQMMLQQKLQMPMRQVAGVDAEQPVVHAASIKPIDQQNKEQQPAQQEPEQESPFTDEEADKLFELMARFKKVEPQYMQLLEAVVTMAENGDGTYNMAKGFLIK